MVISSHQPSDKDRTQWVKQARTPCGSVLTAPLSSVSETYGRQEGAAYNGHFGYECYHPLFLFNQDGNVERVLLRRTRRFATIPTRTAPI
jgi:hypothetical protein